MNIGTLDRIELDAVETAFRTHAADIQRDVRSCPRGFQVLAEVGRDGEWLGCGRVTAGVTTMRAHEGRSVVIYFDADRFASRGAIEERIFAAFDAAE